MSVRFFFLASISNRDNSWLIYIYTRGERFLLLPFQKKNVSVQEFGEISRLFQPLYFRNVVFKHGSNGFSFPSHLIILSCIYQFSSQSERKTVVTHVSCKYLTVIKYKWRRWIVSCTFIRIPRLPWYFPLLIKAHFSYRSAPA